MMPASDNEHIVPDRLRYLFEQYIQQAITSKEELELAQLALLPENEPAFRALEQEYWDREGYQPLQEEAVDRLMKKIAIEPAPVRKLAWRRIAIAASILLVIAAGTYFMFFAQTRSVKVLSGEVATTSDIKAPSTNRAVITLADGSTMYLDSMSDGQLATQGSVQVMKLANGKIAYEPIGNVQQNIVQYNTLSNPRGSKIIDMMLADGSHVWLNAGSSITYPVAFTGAERRVRMSGEAYFEVSHDATRPFYVTKGTMEVKVLGTHFNINAYDDEDAIRVTLLEGSVAVSNGSHTVMIKPGQQAQTTGIDLPVINKEVDLAQVMAWKNGKFQFGEKADIGTIMRQLSRWYDVDVAYVGAFSLHFGGSISRDESISEVLKVLEATGNVRCKIEGRKITVMSP